MAIVETTKKLPYLTHLYYFLSSIIYLNKILPKTEWDYMEELQPLFSRNLECHLCKEKFVTMKCRSKFIKVDHYDTDFCSIYKENSVNGLLYNIFVCPKCGYSFSSDFSTYFPSGTMEELISNICNKWVPYDFSGERSIKEAIRTYKLAAYSATLKKEKHVIIAGLYLRAAWLYRLQGAKQQEQRFMELAFHAYTESFSREDYRGTQISDVRIVYLLGELARRTGKEETAIRYFSKVIENRKRTVETKLIEMAQERWQEIRAAREGKSKV